MKKITCEYFIRKFSHENVKESKNLIDSYLKNSTCYFSGIQGTGKSVGGDKLLDNLLHLLPLFGGLSKYPDSHTTMALGQRGRWGEGSAHEAFSNTKTDNHDDTPDNRSSHPRSCCSCQCLAAVPLETRPHR